VAVRYRRTSGVGRSGILPEFCSDTGPVLWVILFLAVGLINMGSVWEALIPGALYFGIHVLGNI
jgi:hypothetical protein